MGWNMSDTTVRIERQDELWIVTIARPQVRNAVDGPTAHALEAAFAAFDADAQARVAVLQGADGHFCAGADLKAISHGLAAENAGANPLHADMAATAPMGPTRLRLRKPVIAAIEGHAVAGGLELALWCDLRVAAASAVFGVYCRRFGVPLIDGGTVRLPRLIGTSRALDLVLTGRPVDAAEALAIGLANRVVPDGTALAAACDLGRRIAAHPQECLRNDRASLLGQHGLPEREALALEFGFGTASLASGESVVGATRFASGAGRHGRSDPER
jgi:enoyl-CoA hydratase